MPTTTTRYTRATVAAGLLVVGLLIAPAGGVPAPPDGHGGGNGGGGGGGGGGEDPTPTYRFQNLGTFPGTDGESWIHDINSDGMVVGVADVVEKLVAQRLIAPALRLPQPIRVVCREASRPVAAS